MQIKKLLVAFILGLGLTLTLLWLVGDDTPVARAVNIVVQTPRDGVVDNSSCTLREAIIAANTDTAVDTCAAGGANDYISLKTNTYVLTVTGTAEDASATGDLDITDMLTIEGAGPGQTIIDASGVISDRVFDVQLGAGTVVISGVTIINGNVTGNGGGIRSRAADLTLINVEIISNAASISGGGVYVYAGSAALNGAQILSNTAGSMGGGAYFQQSSTTLSGTQVINNVADDGGGVYVYRGGATLNGGQVLSNTASDGGGVYVFGSDTFGGGVFTQTGDNVIAHNTAASDGGGLCVYGYSTATLSGGQILSNSAEYGGGVFAWQSSVTLNGGQVARNAAEYGGGVYAYDSRTTLSGTQVLSNTANQWGGGAYILQGSAMLNGARVVSNTTSTDGGGLFTSGGTVSLSLVSTTVSRNAAGDDGGGLYVGSGPALTLINATIGGNVADDDGGGLYCDSGTITITYTTVASNTSGPGGGAGIHRVGGAITMQNSIVANNGAANCVGAPASNGHNLDSGTTCSFAAPGDITDTDPLIGPLTEDGGTLVYPLLEGSPAIDAGACVAGITADQCGEPRPNPASPFCDIGAYEAKLPAITVTKSGPAWFNPQDLITYTLHVTNTGTLTATGVVLTDTLPASSSFVWASDGGVEASGVVTWPTFNVSPSGGVVTRTFAVTATKGVTNVMYGASALGVPAVQGTVAIRTGLNHPPVAEAGAPQAVTSGSPVTLDGSGSSDPDGQPLSYLWEQTGGTASVTLADADTMMVTFDAPTDTGIYTFTLTITDAYGLSDDDDATITVELNTVYLPLVVRE
jgi:uncharacterized repeat protein (TIGR01451 family)/CSLREA domain-containing protein